VIKQPAAVRARLLKLLSDALFAFRTHITMLPELEPELLDGLEPTGREELTIELANAVLAKFGHASTANPYFDKTRRALNKANRRPRGMTDAEYAAWQETEHGQS
jgi:hypothetical protein